MENLDLGTLKVKSFVTSLTEEKNKTVKGGYESPEYTPDGGAGCDTHMDTCPHYHTPEC